MLNRLAHLVRAVTQKPPAGRPAAPSPALVDLQARYVATADFANRATTDEEGIPAADAAAALSYAILDTPSASLADLLVKARHAAEYLEPGGKDDPSYSQSLDVRAWHGLLSDIERLAGSANAASLGGPRSTSRPVFRLGSFLPWSGLRTQAV